MERERVRTHVGQTANAEDEQQRRKRYAALRGIAEQLGRLSLTREGVN